MHELQQYKTCAVWTHLMGRFQMHKYYLLLCSIYSIPELTTVCIDWGLTLTVDANTWKSVEVSSLSYTSDQFSSNLLLSICQHKTPPALWWPLKVQPVGEHTVWQPCHSQWCPHLSNLKPWSKHSIHSTFRVWWSDEYFYPGGILCLIKHIQIKAVKWSGCKTVSKTKGIDCLTSSSFVVGLLMELDVSMSWGWFSVWRPQQSQQVSKWSVGRRENRNYYLSTERQPLTRDLLQAPSLCLTHYLSTSPVLTQMTAWASC